jgi:putative OPT family oligopeptide transporter
MSSPAAPRELTLRALLTGVVIGAALTPCNIYSGLKIGWSFNMSIAGALLGFAFWRLAEDLFHRPHWGRAENTINQTTASSAASIVSGGLVAPIPALTLITGQTLGAGALMIWVFSVSALGIIAAVMLRNTLIEREALSFPSGTAAGETLRAIHDHGREAGLRVRMLLGSAALAATVKLVDDLLHALPRPSLPGGIGNADFRNLGFSFDPSLLMIGFGAIIGLRAGLSLLLGAVIAWALLLPLALERGWAIAGAPEQNWFGPGVEWLIWPGVSLMTVAALSSLAVTAARRWRLKRQTTSAARSPFPLPLSVFLPASLLIIALAMTVQKLYFDIPLAAGIVAVGLSLFLAIIAGRVVGETGIPPIGAIGKLSQLSFGVVAPGNVTANLMGANVTGGAAGQCTDLLDDLKAGAMVGATPRHQIAAQVIGVLTGSIVGSLTYLALIPDPANMLLTAEWPAPAVATWKAVAEVLSAGLDTLPPASPAAMLIGGIAGLGLTLGGLWLPGRAAQWLPSGTALGLAFVIPAWISISLCLGAVLAALIRHWAPNWAARFVLAIAAGLVAGESLAGVARALGGLAATGT